MNDWLKVNAASDTPEILIDGFIGESWWDDSGNSNKRFNEAISKFPASQRITVRINSEGGSIQDGLGIYNTIKARGNVTTRVDGYALSIASIIALGGDEIISPQSSVWMIHDPWSGTVGDADTHRKSAEMLDKHADTLVSIYATKTGMDRKKVRDLMKEETWMTGEEAVENGFADKMDGEAKTLSALKSHALFRRVPSAVLNCAPISRFGLVAAAAGGFEPPPQVTNNKEKRMENPATQQTTPKAEATTSAPDNRLQQLEAELIATKAAADKERKARIEDKVRTLCAERGRTDADEWIPLCIANEDTVKLLAKQPVAERHIITPHNPTITGGQTWRDQVRAKQTPRAKLDFMIENWDALRQAERSMPAAANTGTTDASLIGSVLVNQAVLVLQNRLAPLRAFSRDFSGDAMAPNRPVVIPKVTAGGTAQASATDFEDTTNFVGTVTPITVTPTHRTAGGYMDQTDMNRGMRVALWAEKKAQEIAENALATVTALITTGNFTATPHISAAAAFGGDDMRTIFGLLKKCPTKYMVIDGEYYARLLPATREEYNVVEAAWPGWNGVFLNTIWTGATTNTVGFACDPQAIAVVAGIPSLPESASRSSLNTSTFTVPELQLTVALNSWYSTKTRTDWFTYDVCFGAALLDATAGLLIKSS